MPTDLEALIDMGFDPARAEIAVKKSGGLQGALEWLEDNQEKSLEDIQAAQSKAAEEEGEDEAETRAQIKELETGQAKSLICNDCGKRFRNADMASYHASKTEHADFSESTEEIAPLTEEEKQARLEELRERLKAKRALKADQDKEDAKKNEKIRQKSTRETQEAKEELARKEQMKEAQRKRQDKLDDLEAKKRIKAKIEADKAERRRKAEEEKAAREGRLPPAGAGGSAATAANAVAAAASALPKPRADHSEAKLKLQTDSGTIMKTLPAETTLFEVAQQLQGETGRGVTSFMTTFPRKTFQGDVDLSKTLKEAGLVPSAVLIVK
ncbi:Uncharacterized protein ESCO_003462 [Escovopsis weberi]|uniref:UBX domain-containing protein n=1 Tax=Escovopsis weberi TaxID=150374 RepID=A0A0M8N8K4_ESCWE|nr:Uncharacterized protein ESCO_003462 [Escovopsis weberi]